MKKLKETEKLLKVVHDLRTQCPWDKKQTHQTLAKYLLEEAYETVDAILKKNRSLLKEELGDVLLQVALHSEIASEKKRHPLTGLDGSGAKLETDGSDFKPNPCILTNVTDHPAHEWPKVIKAWAAACLAFHPMKYGWWPVFACPPGRARHGHK